MTSWRDTASTQAQADLDGLLDAVIPFAERQLAKAGEFYPFGAAVSEERRMTLLAVDPGLGERPESQAMLDALYQSARDVSARNRAAAIVADVTVEGADAVRIGLEHCEGSVLVVLIPYDHDPLKRTVAFGQMSASAGQARVWGSS
jgi:hypothetical protein